MCGICGQFFFRDYSKADPERIKVMTKTIEHRGPDDEGFYVHGPIGLGFRRLSIIDLSGGHQPMTDQEQSVRVVFNGEIYNFIDLRKELESYGHRFLTQSDTEVIVHGYKQWGVDVLDRLNGMFGLAIWDEKNEQLVVARDPMGVKIVYYSIQDGCFTFGSEIRPILAARGNTPGINITALNLFLRYRYTPSPWTIYEDIFKLAPGTMAIVRKGSHAVQRFHHTHPAHNEFQGSDKEALDQLLDIYRDAVKRQLISDVPVGLLLSGGIDSALLLGLMSESGQGWPTFTVGYGQSYRDDELDDATCTSKHFGADNFQVRLDQTRFQQTLPHIISILEEPIASSSVVPMYHVCERAKQDVKVALVGQGPDELFGGYLRHLGIRYGSYWRNMPGIIRAPITQMINHLPRNPTLKRGIYSLGIEDRIKRYQLAFSIIPGIQIDNLFQDGLLPECTGERILDSWADFREPSGEMDELGGFQYIELRSSLPDELLMYADKLSMIHGLETRVPYLDLKVVDFVESLAQRFKIRNGSRKWLHRKLCHQYMPKEIVARKKRGFAVTVVDDWFKDSINNKLDDYLLDSQSLMYSYLRQDQVERLRRDHQSEKDDNHKILFSLVVFEQWLRCHAAGNQ